jgi:acetyl-CoA C-acetyltransferase
MSHAYIVAGCRTPIGKFQGGLASVPAPELGAIAVREALRRTGIDPADVDEVIMGNILSAGLGQAPARQAALKAGLPPTVAAVAVNKMCGSGLKAVMLADQAIRCGDARIIVAGGMENMSRAPFLLMGAREGFKFGHQQMLDHMLVDGLECPFDHVIMGAQADYIAASRGVSRADQDAYATESHRRAAAAIQSGTFDKEIVPVTIAGRKGETVVSRDEGPRPETTAAVLAKLKTAYSSDGTVTAGNSSQLSDGGAAVVVANEDVAKAISAPLKARIVATATSGVEPKEIFIAPVTAIQKVLRKADMNIGDIDLVELNEAFAAMCLACMRPLKLDPAKTNVHGGAIALGHPIGASGGRVLVTLLHALHARNLRRGLAALCLGGGNAVAMVVERE